MRNVTAIIISFLRTEYTQKCIASLREMYPDIKIRVGENGHYSEDMAVFCKEKNAEYIELPFDSGVCVARNRLVEGVETEYVMVGDDDFYYQENKDTKPMVKEMVDFLEIMGNFDLIGGRIFENGELRDYQGFFEEGNGFLRYHKLDLSEGFDTAKLPSGEMKYKEVDLTFNYFVARTEKVKQILWDEKIKVAYEHSSWFLDFKEAGFKVAFSPEPVVLHKPKITSKYPEYMNYRIRKDDKKRFFERHNLRFIEDMNGNIDFPYSKEEIDKIDFLITTFKRKDSLEKLLFSITEFYPNAKITIADQNERFDIPYYKDLWKRVMEKGLIYKPTALGVGYDKGLSFCRNLLVKKTDRPYKLILDDDFVFTERTNIEKFVKIMDSDKLIGIVGGAMEQGKIIHFEFNIEKDGNTIRQVSDGDEWFDIENIKVKETGCVLNFVLMRDRVFNYVKWDDELKITEHTDFYYRMKETPWKIIYTPDVIVKHEPDRTDDEYSKMRKRTEFMAIMMKKHEVNRIEYENGSYYQMNSKGEVQHLKP